MEIIKPLKKLKKEKKFRIDFLLVIFGLCLTIGMLLTYIVSDIMIKDKIKLEEKQEIKQEMFDYLMKQDVNVIEDHVYKYTLLKLADLLPFIVFGLLLGWVLHGIF